MTDETTAASAPEAAPPPAPPQEPESMRDFASKLVNPDGTLNADAVKAADPEHAAAERKTPERGPDGKFVSSDPEKQTEKKDTEEGAAEKAGDTEKDTEPDKAEKAKDGEDEKAEKDEGEGETEKAVKPPASMSAKDREAFYKLPADQQKWLAETAKGMQSGASKKIDEYSVRMQKLEPLERLASQHEAAFAHRGQSAAQGFAQLALLAQEAERDWPNFVREQSRLRGYDPEQIFGYQSQQDEDGQRAGPDPEVQALRQQVARLEQYLAQGEEHRQATTLETMAQTVEAAANDGERFPFFSDVEESLPRIVQGIRAADPSAPPRDILETAYDIAVSRNPEVKAKVEADRRAAEEAARQRKAKEDTARALRAAEGNISGNGILPSGDGISDDPANMREYARREAARLMQA